jgi:hypothetical protein
VDPLVRWPKARIGRALERIVTPVMWSRKRGQIFGLSFDGLFGDQEVFELDWREVV